MLHRIRTGGPDESGRSTIFCHRCNPYRCRWLRI
ncbi:hypothetical protein DW991_10050 [Bacteroides thetaiotaomicron]|nr:hypothetical protein DW991_10050 [Bacteroides thetaiotaomicron]